MAKRLSAEHKQETVNKIELARTDGVGLLDACKKSGISDKTYYNWKSSLKRNQPQKQITKKVHKFVDIPHTPQVTHKDQVAIVVCSVENLKSVLSGLV